MALRAVQERLLTQQVETVGTDELHIDDANEAGEDNSFLNGTQTGAQ